MKQQIYAMSANSFFIKGTISRVQRANHLTPTFATLRAKITKLKIRGLCSKQNCEKVNVQTTYLETSCLHSEQNSVKGKVQTTYLEISGLHSKQNSVKVKVQTAYLEIRGLRS